MNECVFPFETKWNRKDYLEMLEVCKLWFSNRNILDIGCGRGESTSYFNAIGFELKPVSTWRQLDATFLVADGVCLPFDDSSFDGVLLNNVLEHIPDKRMLVSELKRVTKPNSVFVFILPTPLRKLCLFFELPKNFIRVLRGYKPIDWWVHAPEVHGYNWISEFNDFRNWEKFLSTHFCVEEKIYKRNGFQVLFKCLNK